MAVEMFEGFDTFSIAQISRRYIDNVTSGASMVTGRNGTGQALQLNSNTQYTTLNYTARSEYYIGFDFKYTTGGNVMDFYTGIGGTLIGSMTVGFAGTIVTTWGSSSAGVVSAGTWYNIQIHIVISASVGVFLLKVDGNTVINLTSINTGSNNLGASIIRGENSAAHQFDNFWVMNTSGSHSNGFPNGVVEVQVSYPTSDGTYTDWTPSTGSTHYNLVNQSPADDDTTFVSATTIGNKDTYNHGSLSGAISEVHAVMVSSMVKKDDIQSKILHLLVKSGSTLQESPDIVAPLNYTSKTMVLTDDPNTSAQWAASDVNSTEIGIKVIA